MTTKRMLELLVAGASYLPPKGIDIIDYSEAIRMAEHYIATSYDQIQVELESSYEKYEL